MAETIFTEVSGLQDSIYGKSQAPIRMFIEKKAEAFEAQSIISKIFAMDKSNNYAEKYTAMTAMSGFQPVGENGAYPADMMQESFSKTLEHMTWKDSFAISQEMVEDSKLIDLKKQPSAFIAGYYRTREKFGAALLAGAINGSANVSFAGKTFDATSADALPMFSTEHPGKLYSTVQSNKFSDAFSADALGALESAMQDFRGDTGEILSIAPDTIIIPNVHSLKKSVFEAIGADKDPDTSNNGFNYQYGRWNVIVWPYLNQFITSGATPWILMDSQYNTEYAGAVWLDRINLTIHSTIEDNTDANVWRGRARFTAGFNDWRAFAVGGLSGGTEL